VDVDLPAGLTGERRHEPWTRRGREKLEPEGPMRGRIIQVSISKGGLPKVAVPEAYASADGLAGDAHFHTRFHGGPAKALLLVSAGDLAALAAEGFPLGAGSLGENLTIEGIDFRQLRAGQRFYAGEALIELTTLRVPCAELDLYNPGGERLLQARLYDAQAKAGDARSPVWARGGFYAAVVRPGLLIAGATIAMADQAV
jgi:MOSC domain-containing protein YiiM